MTKTNIMPSKAQYTLQTMSETGDVNVNKLIPLFATCCCITSLVPDCQSCIGCVSESTFLCLSTKLVLCKPAVEKTSCWKMCLYDFDIDPLDSILSSRTQCLFFDCRTAIPNNEKVPCLCTTLGLTICFNLNFVCQCCASIGDMKR